MSLCMLATHAKIRDKQLCLDHYPPHALSEDEHMKAKFILWLPNIHL